jgi:low affinity Fe/Cu permease
MSRMFAELANLVSEASGRPFAFGVASFTVVIWLLSGPIFGFSDTWQLVMNTWTDIVTVLMVFAIQNSQNRHSAALQAKLDELIRVSEARNAFVGLEQLSHEEIENVRQRAHGHLADQAQARR